MSRGKGLNVQGDQRKYQQPPQEIDISQTDTITCEKCGNASFIQSYFLKRVSALVSPTGKEAFVPLQVFACGNCGTIPKNMMSMVENE